MPHAFISYLREDSALVDRLARDLRRSGVEVWLDRESIRAGARWEDAIARAIDEGAFFLACFSRAYLQRDSTYMDEELSRAAELLRQRTPPRDWLLPLLLDDVPAEGLARRQEGALHDLHALQAVDLSADWQDGLRRVLDSVAPPRSFGRCLNERPVPGAVTWTGGAPLLALDFGTSYSLLSWQGEGATWKPVIGPQGRALHPSVVTFSDRWDYWVGWEALAAAAHRPAHAVFNLKRLLGRGGEVDVGHKRFDAVTLCSLVLRHLRDCAAQVLGADVRNVVAAVPANYSWAQMSALVAACTRAGLRVVRLMPEPNAAGVLAVDWFRGRLGNVAPTAKAREARVLVVDVGGGTTDVSLLELADVEGEDYVGVEASAGDNELGGMDYDAAVREALRRRHVNRWRAQGLAWGEADEQELLLLARQAKEALSQAETWAGGLNEREVEPGLPATLALALDRHQFAEAVQALDERVLSLVDQVLQRAGAAHTPPRAVLLAGQGARVLSLAAALRQRFAKCEIIDRFQENAVARGMGSYLEVLEGRSKGVLLHDAVSREVVFAYCRQERTEDGAVVVDGNFRRFTSVTRFFVAPEAGANSQWHPLVSSGTSWPSRQIARLVPTDPGPLRVALLDADPAGLRAETLAELSLTHARKDCELWLEADIDRPGAMTFTLREAGAVNEMARWHCAIPDLGKW